MATIRLVSIVWVGACMLLVSTSASSVRGQEFLAWVDDQAVMAGVIQNLDVVSSYVRDFDTFDNKHWEGAFALLMDERFPILSPEQLESLNQWSQQALDVIGNIEEIGFIVHDIGPENLSVTVMVLLSESAGDSWDLEAVLDWVKGIADDNSDSPWVTNTLGNPVSTHAGDWLLISNNDIQMEQVALRIRGELGDKFRSMRDSRKFKMAVAGMQGVRFGIPVLTLYGNPSKVRGLFPDITDTVWETYQIEEMPSFGLQIRLTKNINARIDVQDEAEPQFKNNLWAVIDCSVYLTEPRTGFGLLLDSYRPIGELPDVPEPPTWFSAEFFDPQKKFDANKVLYESRSDKEFETYEELLITRNRKEYFSSIPQWRAKMSDAQIVYSRFIEGEANGRIVVLQPVTSPPDALAYAEALVKRSDSSRRNGPPVYNKIDCEFGELWTERELTGIGKSSVFVNDRYIMQGNEGAILEIAGNVGASERFTGNDQMLKLLETLEGLSRTSGKTFKFEYGTTAPEKSRYEGMERDLIDEKVRSKFTGEAFNTEMARVRAIPINEYGYRAEIETESDRNTIVRMLIMQGIVESLGDRLTLYSQTSNQLRIVRGFYR